MRGWYNDSARELVAWAHEESNRVKASHIMVAAEKMESNYVQHHAECGPGRGVRRCPVPSMPRPESPKGQGCFADQAPPYGSGPSRTK